MTQDLKTKLIEEAQERFDKTIGNDLYYLGAGDDEIAGIKAYMVTEIGNVVDAVKEEMLQWAIGEELPEVTCHLSHKDLVDGYNQALLKLRQFLTQTRPTHSLDHIFGDVQKQLDGLTITKLEVQP